MTTTIHKQTLQVIDLQTIRLPLDAEILCAREQREHICIWYRFDPDKVVTKDVQIAVCGTGHPSPATEESKYLGTALLYDSSLVFHVFQRLYPEAK
jgi:hypothetical protein